MINNNNQTYMDNNKLSYSNILTDNKLFGDKEL